MFESALPARAWKRRQILVLVVAAIAYGAMFAIYYPPIHTSMDESTYLNMAYAYRHGTQYADVAGVMYTLGFEVNGGHSVGIYPPVIPLLLACLSFFGWPSVFAMNLLLHLAIFCMLIYLLRLLRVPPIFALLYLFHPTAVIFSRTVMSDFASSLLILAAVMCFLNRRWYLCGAAIGSSLLIRHANVIALPLLAVGCLVDLTVGGAGESSLRGRVLISLRCAAGAAPFLLAAFAFQHIVQEGGWSRIHVPPLSPRYLATILPVHASSLLLLYPGMLLAPLLYRGIGKVSLCVLLYGYLLFFGCFYTYDVGSSWAETFVVRQRYLFAVIPIFIALYASVVWRWAQHWAQPLRVGLSTAAIVCLVLGCAAIHYRHDQYLQKMALVRSELLRIVAPGDDLFCNMQIAKLFHPGWGARNFSIIGGNDYRTEVARAEIRIDASSKRADGHVVVANWTRGYRAEAGFERESVRELAMRYYLQPLNAAERGALPDDVEVFRVAGAQ